MTGPSCPARIRPFPGTAILDCELAVDHPGGAHEGAIRNAPGSVTKVVWLDDDRRTFTGDWIECPHHGCVLPANHRGGHAL